MALLSIVRSSIFQLFSLIFVLGYFLGIVNIHFSDKNNYCVMTYMYEYPQFVRLSIPENKEYPQYGLYAYSEGRLTERARKMWFDGIPVLFLPGNCGSHMQARSLASVALRKALSNGYEYHFDYFTMSTNEELSGLYGGVLQSQTRFAAASISKILSLYKSNKYTKSVPTSVILIGHSMGGLIAKRLLAHPSTINSTNIAITLAAPLEAPVVTFDVTLNDYYTYMNYEWQNNVNSKGETNKMLISFGNGPRDLLVPSGLTSSNDSYINALTTAVPGVWVSPDHVCIVWCKQLVMAINRYLYSIVDPITEQVTEDQAVLKARARQYFQANRSMTLDPNIPRANSTMVADAFWYEDNRRIYQVSRPEISKMTYLMIRLVKYPQNRFVAVEAVNLDDQEWIFGCNAKFTYHMHRYCKYATSLSELSRWTGAANDHGRRKLATVHLHTIMDQHPDWTHIIVKVSPTRKPITLNVDINDHASRQIYITAPSDFYPKTTIITETEPDSLYYEIVLKEFNVVHQAYLLYVEPTAGCSAVNYHVSGELHVPWAKNHEFFHYFTHNKRSPMKLRLYKSNPNVTSGLDAAEFVKVTLLLDPQCTFTISISSSWYHRLAQLARNYTPVLVPYIAAIVLLVTRANILSYRDNGRWTSVHTALGTDTVKPYFSLVCARLVIMGLTSIPFLSFIFETASWRNMELQHFTRSLLVVPAYMTALGVVEVGVALILAVMIFSSQIAHRLMFRIIWRRGGGGLAEKVGSALQRAPMVVSCAIVGAAPFSCGAASLATGAVFYAFMLSKMYEEYLEDYFYKILAKIASKACMYFKRSKTKSSREPDTNLKGENVQWSNLEELEQECFLKEKGQKHDNDDELTNLNFHMTMFLMWLTVTIVNIPVLLTWARNFKYSVVLKPDTSYHTGVVLSACSIYIWQMDGPRKNLRHYEAVSSFLFTMATFIIALGPFSLAIVNYGVALMFLVITAQQILDKEIGSESDPPNESSLPQIDNKEASIQERSDNNHQQEAKQKKNNESDEFKKGQSTSADENKDTKPSESNSQSDGCECSESRIYRMFKNIREKFSFDS